VIMSEKEEEKTSLWRQITLTNTKRVAATAIFIAINIILAPVFIPVGPTKCFPAQHLINVTIGALLGPMWAVISAIVVSVIRNLLGIGTIFAFPGSIPGAFLDGLFFWLLFGKKLRYVWGLIISEWIGTGLIGALLSAYVIGPAFFGPQVLALGGLYFITAFSTSCVPGAIIGVLVLLALYKIGLTHRTFM